MNATTTRRAANLYARTNVQGGIEAASPHRVIQMLLDGALRRLATVKGHMQRNSLAEKGAELGKAISIVEGLRASLDLDTGHELAERLDSLYDYILRRLLIAGLNNDVAILEEVEALLGELKRGWDGIEDHAERSLPEAMGA